VRCYRSHCIEVGNSGDAEGEEPTGSVERASASSASKNPDRALCPDFGFDPERGNPEGSTDLNGASF
jgi:hypothetical protein